ncbi:MAG: FtsH protease activity modulator HflK [Acidobacteriaceae bacterium]|nr:FtsH protease activity modulator HflK [Acidobacteriaceae bacterium]
MSSTFIESPAIERAQEPALRDARPAEKKRHRILLGTALLWLASAIYVVRPDQQAVVTRLGAVVHARVYPGIHYAFPFPIDRVYKVKVNQLQRLMIGGDVADSVLGRTQPLASQFLTGDQNIINMRVAVQYFVATPADYLFRSVDVAKSVGSVAQAELARRIAHRSVDAVLTTEKTAIQEQVLRNAQAGLDEYRTGVRLANVSIESVTPPAEVADAFRDVASARADTGRIIDEAHGYANDVVPKARGEAQQTLESAEAYRQAKVNEATGDAARFIAVAAEYAKAPQVSAGRLYTEAMEQILPKIRKLIIDANGNVDLSIIRKGDAAPKP